MKLLRENGEENQKMERWKKKSRGGWCWLVKGEMSADEGSFPIKKDHQMGLKSKPNLSKSNFIKL